MAQTRLQRATVSDVALIDLLKGWTPAETLPPDDRIVLIARTSPVGSQLLLRDMGYYDHIEEELVDVIKQVYAIAGEDPQVNKLCNKVLEDPRFMRAVL